MVSAYASAPPARSSAGFRSQWGDFSEEDEANVVLALLGELSPDIDGTVAAVTAELDGAREAGLPQHVGDSLVKVLNNAQWTTQQIMPLLIQFFYFARNTSILKKYRLVHPAYRVFDDHYQNAEEPGGTVVQVPPVVGERRWKFLDYDVSFPIGVAASSLTTNSNCVQRLFRGGYNVVTYKTVRSQLVAPFRAPNWTFVAPTRDARIPDNNAPLQAVPEVIGSELLSTANSFGVPSSSPDVWMRDFEVAMASARPGQVLICSVLGEDYSSQPTEAGVVTDFVKVASQAVEAGARVVELNLSCPNTLAPSGGMRPALCQDSALTGTIVRAVRDALPEQVRVGVKLSALTGASLTNLLNQIYRSIDFVCGINTIPREVVDYIGNPFFPGRAQAGVGGAAISGLAVAFVRECSMFRDGRRANFEIVGVGGVTDVKSFSELFAAGADVVQSVSGVFMNTLLAQDCISALSLTLPGTVSDHLKRQIVATIASRHAMPAWRVYAAIPEQPKVIKAALHELIEDGRILESPATRGSFVEYGATDSVVFPDHFAPTA